jgi:hypothetical protein
LKHFVFFLDMEKFKCNKDVRTASEKLMLVRRL